jgi:acetyltransferase-like isoleucine patch superfamily enzyme
MMNIVDNGSGNVIRMSPREGRHGTIRIDGNDNQIRIADFDTGNLDITIYGDGTRIRLEHMRRVGKLRMIVKDGARVRIGEWSTVEDCYILADRTQVRIGRDCMISSQVSIRTTDAHGIYDLESGELLNAPTRIVIEDHVWLAQGVIVTGGSHIGSNTILGAQTYVSGKTIPGNALVAGTPARVLRTGIAWDRRMTPNLYAPNADTDHHLWAFMERRTPD